MFKVFVFVTALFLLAACENTKKETVEASASANASHVSETAAPPAAEETNASPVAAVPGKMAVSDKPAVSDNTSMTDTSADPTTVTSQDVQENTTSPALLFQKCAACHGSHAEKSALNQSAIIGTWDSQRIAAAIKGYQDGTYGGNMKTLMQSQVKGLSPVEIQALSEYIANLYVRTH